MDGVQGGLRSAFGTQCSRFSGTITLGKSVITTRTRIGQRPFCVGPWIVQFGESSTLQGTYLEDLDA